MKADDGNTVFYGVFGQYVLTHEVFEQLADDIKAADAKGDYSTEIELTRALDTVRQRSGMVAVTMQGSMFDMGNPAALRRAMYEFSEVSKD